MASAILLFLNPDHFTILDWSTWDVLSPSAFDYESEALPNLPAHDLDQRLQYNEATCLLFWELWMREFWSFTFAERHRSLRLLDGLVSKFTCYIRHNLGQAKMSDIETAYLEPGIQDDSSG